MELAHAAVASLELEALATRTLPTAAAASTMMAAITIVRRASQRDPGV
jgi:hypothetical protein